MENILEISGLNKTYDDFSLSDVTFTLPEGCITGFIGINGSGKTTTIRSILGLTNSDYQQIKIFGMDIKQHEKEIKNRIGIVLGDECFYEELSMTEMKSIIAPAYQSWSDKEYKDNMDRFNLNPKQKISTLSKGMRMKFSLVLAISHQAELLIMDEPTSGLDPLIRTQFLSLITEYMQKDGCAVLFSTHITSDLEKIADMLVMIHNGKIVFEDEKDALIENHRLVKGTAQSLNDENKKLFLNTQITDYGFTGMTAQIKKVQNKIPNILIEHPTIEDIMLAYIERG